MGGGGLVHIIIEVRKVWALSSPKKIDKQKTITCGVHTELDCNDTTAVFPFEWNVK